MDKVILVLLTLTFGFLIFFSRISSGNISDPLNVIGHTGFSEKQDNMCMQQPNTILLAQGYVWCCCTARDGSRCCGYAATCPGSIPSCNCK